MSEKLRTIGASIALITRTDLGRCVLAVQRTNNPQIPYPGYWEFPGGGMEPGESDEDCARREFYEETGIWVPEAALAWRALYRSKREPEAQNAFFVAHMRRSNLPALRLSDEAQAGGLMPVEEFCAQSAAVPAHVAHFEDYEREQNGVYLRHPDLISLVA